MIGTLHPYADRRMHELTNETLDLMWKSDLYGLFWLCRYGDRTSGPIADAYLPKL